jgi:anaerobic magnesium-protoporphyrin IX monomethyl ester cyclase
MSEKITSQRDYLYGPLENLRAINPPFLYDVNYLKILGDKPDIDINRVNTFNGMDFSQYRSHNWHGWTGESRTPYACVSTSFGCPFSCKFCALPGYFKNKYQVRDVDVVIKELEILHSKGVRNIRIMDEVLCGSKRIEKLCRLIIKKHLKDLNMWAYTRFDTVDIPLLGLMREAGFRWFGIGIESGNEEERKSSGKIKFNNSEIRSIVRAIQKADIHICGNFIFGFPNDTWMTMCETFNFALELLCESTFFFPMMAFPGTKIREIAENNGWEIPTKKEQFSYYSYESLPVRTHFLTSAEVLRFRDRSFTEYYTHPRYLEMIKRVFGDKVVDEIKTIASIKMKRKIYA